MEPDSSAPCTQQPATLSRSSHTLHSTPTSLKVSLSYFISLPLVLHAPPCRIFLHFTSVINFGKSKAYEAAHYLQFSGLLVWPLSHVVIFTHYPVLKRFIVFPYVARLYTQVQLILSHLLPAAALKTPIYDSSIDWRWAPPYPPSRGSEWPLPYITWSHSFIIWRWRLNVAPKLRRPHITLHCCRTHNPHMLVFYAYRYRTKGFGRNYRKHSAKLIIS
jgi:hypothetical protein